MSNTEPYIVGLDETGNYVSKHRDTGELLNSMDIHSAKPSAINYSTFSGDNSAFFESYEGQFVNGKREGMGIYGVLDVSEGKSTIEFEGIFENNLPTEGKLTFMENGQYYTTIEGVFVNGLPDETRECKVTHRIMQDGKTKEEIIMKGFISFRNEKGVYPQNLEGKLSPNQPYNLLDVYLSFGFKVNGTKQTYPPPTEVGVFSSDGKKLSSLGGARSKKRSNHKRKYSHKN